MHKERCRLCGNQDLRTFCDLGSSPLSNAYLPNKEAVLSEKFYPLHAKVCPLCFLVQLPEIESPDTIFCDYAYFSSYSSSWLEHCKHYVESITKRLKLDHHSFVIEIASNDGYLLQFFKEKMIPHLGIEPAENVAKEAQKKGIETKVAFFSSEEAKSLAQADLILGNNVLAHTPYLNDFIKGLKIALKPLGCVTLEFPHLLKLMELNQFDTIYHEHFSYFSLLTLQKAFQAQKLEVFDVDEIPTHGGSLRLYVKHEENSAQPISERVKIVLQKEYSYGLDKIETYDLFAKKVKKIKEELVSFLDKHPNCIAYGAPAKGNTLLNFCQVGPEKLLFTVDKSPHKQGKLLPGTHIPIYDPGKIFEMKPKYVLILPWNLKEEIMEQLKAIRDWGGQFVIPIPELLVV